MGGKRVNPDSNFQPRKCAKRHQNNDWISQLPDEILVVVLSLLPLKEAARTSVLSTRWIHLWKHTLCLDFEAESSLDKIAENRELRKSERCKYVRWVNSVIESHKGGSTLKDFRICFDLGKCAQEEITKWLEFAFMRQVERLGLELLEYGDFMKPSSKIFAFPEHLLLVNSLKSLKALCLKSVDVTDEAVHFFLRNCQFLEQLTVHGANKITNLEVCGSSLGLKHLEICCCFSLESIKVSAPNLTTLIVTKVKRLLLVNVPMLKKEDIIEQCKFPQLPKLKKLVISYREKGDESLMVLTYFIKVSPYLQEFVIKISDEEKAVKEEKRRVKSMGFPHHHLKFFTFEGYIGRRSDVELVKFILENCVMIEKIIIDPRVTNKPNPFTKKPYHTRIYPHLLEKEILEEEKARNYAKQQLPSLVPQHIKFFVL